jgi:transposase InsO family protein
VHFAVSAHPSAEWTVQQLREAFPWDSAPPRYLLRDRNRIFGQDFVDQVKAMGIKQVLSAPRSPWQRAYVKRLIGSICRECLDHIIIFGERSLHPALVSYLSYYTSWRTHLSLRNSDEPSLPLKVRSSKFVKSVDCTIITNGGPPNSIDHTPAPDQIFREDPPKPIVVCANANFPASAEWRPLSFRKPIGCHQ